MVRRLIKIEEYAKYLNMIPNACYGRKVTSKRKTRICILI